MLALWVFYRLVHAPLQNAPPAAWFGAAMVAKQVVEYAVAFRKLIWRHRHASTAGAALALYALSSMAWTEWGQYYFCVCPSPISKHLDTNDVRFTVMLTLNDGYVDFFHAWFAQYKRLGLPYEVLVIAEDDKALKRLQQKYLSEPLVLVERGHINSSTVESGFNSFAYKQMMAARATHMLRHLTVGKNLLFADVDAFWVSDPLQHFSPEYDMWMPVEKPALWPFRTHNYHNAGFMGVLSNTRTIGLIKSWERELIRLGASRNQRVLHDLLVQSDGEPNAVHLQSLPHLRFPSGHTYFEHGCKRDAVVVHVNSIFRGHAQKQQALRAEGLWTDQNYEGSRVR